MPIDLLENQPTDLLAEAESNNRVIDETLMNYNASTDEDGIKAEVATEPYYNPIDGTGEVYHGKLLKPEERVKEMQGIQFPEYDDQEFLDVMAMSSAEYDQHLENKKNETMDEVLTAQENYKNGSIRAKVEAPATKLEEDYRRRKDQLRLEFADANEYYKSSVKGVAFISNIAVSAIEASTYLPHYAALAESTGVDPLGNLSKNLSREINLVSESLAPSKTLQKEWMAKEGHLWKDPQWLIMSSLEMFPTVAVSAVSGQLTTSFATKLPVLAKIGEKLPTVKKILDSALFGTGSAFMESASNAGDAMTRAREAGATKEQVDQIGGNVFLGDFAQGTLFNAISYGSGKFAFSKNKGLKHVLKKTAGVVGGVALQGEEEIRQDERQEVEMATTMGLGLERTPSFLLPRLIPALIDPKKRDTAMYALFLGGLDPALGFLSEMKNKVAKTGEGKASLDKAVNRNKAELNKRLEELKAEESAEPKDPNNEMEQMFLDFREKEINIIEDNLNDVDTANFELKMLEAEKELKILSKNTVEGLTEDSSIGEQAIESIEQLPDANEQATAEQINAVIESVIAKEEAETANGRLRDDETGLKHEDANYIREVYGLDKLTKGESIAMKAALDNAKHLAMNEKALEISDAVIADPEGRLLTMTEHAGLVMKEAELQNQADVITEEIVQANKDGNRALAKGKEKQRAKIEKNIDTITEASFLGGSALGRALNFRKIRINRKTFNLASMKAEAKKAKGKDLTPKEVKVLREAESDLAKATKVIEKLTAKLEKAEMKQAEKSAKETIKDYKKKGKKENASVYLDEVFEEMADKKTSDARRRLLERKAKVLEDLQSLGVRVNDVTGVTAEVITKVGILSEILIEEGVHKLPELRNKIMEVLPDLSPSEATNAIGKRKKSEIPKLRKQTSKMVKLLQKQANLEGQVRDGASKIFEQVVKNEKLTNRSIEKLNDLLQEVKNYYGNNEQNRQKVELIQKRISDVQWMLATEAREKGKVKPLKNAEWAKIEKELGELEALMNTKDKIVELNEALEDNDKLIDLMTPKKQADILSEDLRDAKVHLFALKRHARAKIHQMGPMTVGRVWRGFAGTLMANLSADLGYGFRQTRFAATSHPMMSARTWFQMLDMQKTGIYDKKKMQAMFDSYMYDIENNPHYAEWVSNKLAITDPVEGMNHREEAFIGSNLIERLPYWGTNIIKASENAHTMGLNLMRIGLYEDFKAKNPTASKEVMKAYAQYVNMTTGRGSLPGAEKAAGLLTNLFLAPRWVSSGFGAVFAPVNLKYMKHPEIRKEMARDYSSYLTTRLAVLALGAAGGGEVEFDPISPDFLKLKFGNTRYDIWGGNVQPVRLMLSLVKIAKSSMTDPEKTQATSQVLKMMSRYFFYKTNPGINYGHSMVFGENVLGRDQSRWETTWRAVVPLIMQTSVELAKDQGVGSLLYNVPLEFSGINVSSYEKHKAKNNELNSYFD